jgi:hypothetical protein
MGKVFDEIDDALATFISRQHVFFVGTAPTGPGGHVNVSPKGLDTFRILGPRAVAYLDLTGSGIETAAHLNDNGRVTVMFCAFDGPPKIVRLYGRGSVVQPGQSEFAPFLAQFPEYPGVRSIVRIDLDRISDSCGFGVPRLQYVDDRDQMIDWAEHKGAQGLATYQQEHNQSIDGLIGL